MTGAKPHAHVAGDHPRSARATRPDGVATAGETAGRVPPRIVAGVDGSARDIDAVALARQLARAAGAELVVATVCPVDLYAPATLTARDDAWTRIERIRPSLGGFERWEPRVVDAPSPARGLHELAARERAELLVLGSTHRGPVRRLMLGSVARRLLHGAPCAVAITPHGHRPPALDAPLLVGVAFDASAESRLALAAGARWARDMRAGLRVVTALQLPGVANPMFGTVSYGRTVDAMRSVARHRLTEACATLDVPGGVATEVVEGDPVSVLTDESARLDLLLIGSRTYGPVRAVLVGGVSGPVVERAACPVVVLPRGLATPAPRAAVADSAPAAGPA